MKKGFVLTAIAAALALVMTGCSVNYSSTSTTTTTHTDADGKTTTVTTTSTNENGHRTETTETTVEEPANKQIVAKLSFINETGVDMYELYFASSQADTWGSDILGDQAPLKDGEMITYNSFKYTPDDALWDFLAKDENGGELEFDMLDFNGVENPENISISLKWNAERETFTATY